MPLSAVVLLFMAMLMAALHKHGRLQSAP